MNNFGDPLEEYADRSLNEIKSEYNRIVGELKSEDKLNAFKFHNDEIRKVDKIETWEDVLDLMKGLRNYIDNVVEMLEHKNTDEYFNTCVVVNSNDDEVNDLEAKIHL